MRDMTYARKGTKRAAARHAAATAVRAAQRRSPAGTPAAKKGVAEVCGCHLCAPHLEPRRDACVQGNRGLMKCAAQCRSPAGTPACGVTGVA